MDATNTPPKATTAQDLTPNASDSSASGMAPASAATAQPTTARPDENSDALAGPDERWRKRVKRWIWSRLIGVWAVVLRMFSPAKAHAFLSGAESRRLRPLTPRFEADKHGVYVQHLLEGLATDGVHNIALAGRYGAGKSSVIAGLVKHLGWRRRRRVVQLSLSTLDPKQPVVALGGGSAASGSSERPGEPEQAEGGRDNKSNTDAPPPPLALSTTNRIQKELVKQLLYRERPRKLPDSRFHRITRRAPVRSALIGAGVAAFTWAALYVLDLMPPVVPVGNGDLMGEEQAGRLLLAALLAIAVGFVHFVAWGRVSLLGVAAAGTSVTLGPKSSSYFDQYLDEVIYFFEKTRTDIVIFEDLDRFDDHHIFQSLRDLNTLLNSRSRQRRRKIRFVYATKDSLFEGHAKPKGVEDQAVAEMDRANRTKFFELVVPVVPFISHRNARDLMGKALAEAGWEVGSEEGQLDPRLVDTVARNATEMRMITNICNEFSVFASQLLPSGTELSDTDGGGDGGGHGAPGLEADKLLALVAYKNFYLKDFELILRRESKLDTLAAIHDELVRANLDLIDQRMRSLERKGTVDAAKSRLARRLGKRLSVIAGALLTARRYGAQTFGFKTDNGGKFSHDLTMTPEFWAAAASSERVTLAFGQNLNNAAHAFSKSDWADLWPEAADGEAWKDLDRAEHARGLASLAAEATAVRGAGFKFAYDHRNYEVEWHDAGADLTLSFSEWVDRVLVSELGKDLIREGFLDRNFGLYAAQFYGDFSGRDVAEFIYQAVQPNKMLENFQFADPASIESLFREVSSDFTSGPSVLNIEIFDYLLAASSEERDEALAFLADNIEGVGQGFIDTYFNRGEEREELAAALARLGWEDVLVYLTSSEAVPERANRPGLVSAALLALPSDVEVAVGSGDVGTFIDKNLTKIPAINETQSAARAAVIYGVLERAGFLVTDLSDLGATLVEKVVDGRSYRLTLANLTTAARVDGVDDELTLERLMRRQAAWDYCLAKPDSFLAAVGGDNPQTLTADEATLIAALTAARGAEWDENQLVRLVSLSAPEVAVVLDDGLDIELWPLLAAGDRLELTVSNLAVYVEQVGVDEALAGLLTARLRAGDALVVRPAEGDEEQAASNLAVAVLHAAETLTSAQERVAIAAQLRSTPLPVSRLPIEQGELLGQLLEHGLVDDLADAFVTYRRELGWAGLAPVAGRDEFLAELAPDVVEDAVADLLADARTPAPVVKVVLNRLAEFVPDDDSTALAHAANACRKTAGAKLNPAQVVRIARVVGHTAEVLQLLAALSKTALPNEQFVEALSHLSLPLAHFHTKAETQFDLPGDTAEAAVVRKAETRRLAKLTKKPLSKTKVEVL